MAEPKPRRHRARTRAAAEETPEAATLDAIWQPGPPPAEARWTVRPWVHPSDRAAEGLSARDRVPRHEQASFTPRADRDPIAILAAQEQDRLHSLLPIRHARMAASPFAYYRGTPAVMAADLADTPRTGIIVQASGDAHIANFGLFASPERTLVFDANDFDETLPGPWEWDVKRLVTSVVIASRENGFGDRAAREAALASARGYREAMADYAGMKLIDIWYARITDRAVLERAEESGALDGRGGRTQRTQLEEVFSKARQHDGMAAFASLTEVVDGRRVIVEDPPVVRHVDMERHILGGAEALEHVFANYRASMSEHKRVFLERYRFVDWALKAVGVGSVGTRCFIIVLEGRDEDDPLIMQAKQATASVLEPYLGPSLHPHHGQRVVVGQQLMQAVSDIFLGWTSGPEGYNYYLRQLWDMKGSVDLAALDPVGMRFYGGLCAWSLARAHAHTGDAVAIAAYLGDNDHFDEAVADFAETYADLNEQDHRAYVEAIEAGRISVPAEAGDSAPPAARLP